MQVKNLSLWWAIAWRKPYTCIWQMLLTRRVFMLFDIRFCNNYAFNELKGREIHECPAMTIFIDIQGVWSVHFAVFSTSKVDRPSNSTVWRSFSCYAACQSSKSPLLKLNQTLNYIEEKPLKAFTMRCLADKFVQ